MSFPAFLPTVPVFVRTLAKQHKSTTLIASTTRASPARYAESHSARLAGGLLACGAGKGTRKLDKRRSRRRSRSESTADILGVPPVSLRGDPVP